MSLTTEQARVLSYLHLTEWQTARDLSRRMNLPSRQIAFHMKVLIRLKLAEAEPDRPLYWGEPPKQYRRKSNAQA